MAILNLSVLLLALNFAQPPKISAEGDLLRYQVGDYWLYETAMLGGREEMREAKTSQYEIQRGEQGNLICVGSTGSIRFRQSRETGDIDILSITSKLNGKEFISDFTPPRASIRGNSKFRQTFLAGGVASVASSAKCIRKEWVALSFASVEAFVFDVTLNGRASRVWFSYKIGAVIKREETDYNFSPTLHWYTILRDTNVIR